MKRPTADAASAASGVEQGLLQRIKSEFLEMPGLRLTRPQASRLWGLDDVSCSALLASLVDSRFLFQTRDGAFMRIDLDQTRARPATGRARSAVA